MKETRRECGGYARIIVAYRTETNPCSRRDEGIARKVHLRNRPSYWVIIFAISSNIILRRITHNRSTMSTNNTQEMAVNCKSSMGRIHRLGRMRIELWVKRWNTEVHTATAAPHVLSLILVPHLCSRAKLSCSAVPTPIDIVIQSYLRKLHNKFSVKHVHIDKNITLNIEHFQLRLIAVLSGRCHLFDFVWFNETKSLLTRIMSPSPLFCCTSPHKVHEPTMVF